MAACPVGRVPPDMRKDGYFMKSMKRRLLSLFMAMVMVCSLVPGALAADASISVNPTDPKPGDSVSLSLSNVTIPENSTGVTYSWKCGNDSLNSSTNTASYTVPTTASAGTTLNFSCEIKYTPPVGSTPSGEQTINATGSATVKAAEVVVDGITLNSNNVTTIKVDGTTTWGYTLSPAGASASVSWESKNPSVATVDSNGKITGKSAGTAEITAKVSDSISAKATITVEAKDPSISVTPSASTVEVGKSISLDVKTTNAPAGATITVEASGTGAGTVSGSQSPYTFTATKAGTVTITAKLISGGQVVASQTANVTVTEAAIAATLTPSNKTPQANGSITVDLLVTSEADRSRLNSVEWSVSSTDKAKISSSTAYNSTTGAVRATVDITKTGELTITATFKNGSTVVGSKSVTVNVQTPLTISGTSTLSYPGAQSQLTAYFNNKVVGTNAVTWSLSSTNSNVTSNSYIALSDNRNGTATITAIAAGTTTVYAFYTENNEQYVGSISIKVTSSAQVNPSVTVYDGNAGYALTDDPDEGRDSIADQIDDWVENYYKSSKYSYSYELRFDQTGDSNKAGYLNASTKTDYSYDELSDVIFEPTPLSGTTKSATASYNFTLYVYTNNSYNPNKHTGTVTFNIKPGSDSSGDIVYSASLGQDVSFDVSDFEDFYNDKYSRGYLEYVTFGSSTANGTLYNEDGKSAGSSSYYVDPSSRQKGLDGIYFSPKSTMKKSTTVKISFTAYGTTRDDSGDGKAEGTVTIIYLNDSAKDITYNTTAGKVTLSAQDFIDAYKEATGSKTAPSNLTIEFQNVPTNGTLTYTGGSKDKDLTKSNVKSNRYTTKNSGSYRLAQLTYTGTRGKDTIEYIAYSGSTAQFTGKVVFNGTAAVPTDVVVTYGSTGGQAVRFSQNDFVSANSAMSKATKVRFVAPANGTLLMNGASASGVDIATTLLGTVTYQPKSGFNGQDKIIFAAYDASNNTVASGTVNITVIGNPTTGTTPGGTPGGVSDVSQFKDVSATAWYRDNLATLVRKGIITGKGDGKFDPLGTVTYGEALKMVLESCGYTAALGTGSNWAINYKNLAVSRGWISSDIDLNAAISRNATAELTAKVLGVSAVTSGSPFADEANGYAAALYYTSPQIFAGSPNPNGGKPLFKNSSPLLRQEVCAVICRVSDYHTQHTTNNMPDGI